VEVIPKSDQTMPRYPECVWSRAEESEHIEIVRRRGKSLEGVGKCQKHWNMWLVTGKTCVTDQVMSQ